MGADPRATLPFDGFLELLADHRLVLGVHERLQVGQLLARWPGTDRESLGDAIAALLARNPEELALIRDRFLEWSAPPAPPDPVATKQTPPTRWWKIAGASLAAAAAVAGLALSIHEILPDPIVKPDM